MRRKLITIFLCLAVFGFAGNLHADQVYDNGVSLWDGAASINSFVEADDFVLSAEATLVGASIDVWRYDNNMDYSGLNWWIFTDNNSLGYQMVGNVLYSGQSVNDSFTYIGEHDSGNADMYQLGFDFGSDVSLDANTVYWLGLNLIEDQETVVWSNSLVTYNNNMRSPISYLPGFNFSQPSHHAYDHAFRLFDDQDSSGPDPDPNPPVPEPATMLLFGTGLAGLAAFRRKFKK